MIIRKLQPDDAEAVFAMMRRFYDSPAVIHTSSDAVLRRDIADCLSDMPLLEGFVFDEGGKLLGYAMCARSYTTEYGGLCIWVEDLYLTPEARNQGLGSAFFAFLTRQYPDAVRFKLEVEPENEAAVHTYRKNGYAVSEYYLMTKETDPDL